MSVCLSVSLYSISLGSQNPNILTHSSVLKMVAFFPLQSILTSPSLHLAKFYQEQNSVSPASYADRLLYIEHKDGLEDKPTQNTTNAFQLLSTKSYAVE